MSSAMAADSNEDNGSPKHHLIGHDQYVKLNVGGSLFLTTIGTLTKYDSMLKAMFSGRLEVRRDRDGYVLVDRCGKHFGLILNFLREGTLPLPECRQEVLEILIEAKYYLLQELVEHCYSWLKTLQHDQLVSTLGVCRVPIVVSKKQVEQIVQSCAGKPVIELLLNRQNNKYSPLYQKHWNRKSGNLPVDFLRKCESQSRGLLHFNYLRNGQKADKTRIYEEALNVLLTFDHQGLSGVCTRCKRPNDDGSVANWPDFLAELPAELNTGLKQLGPEAAASIAGNGRIDWRLEQLAIGALIGAEEGGSSGHQLRRKNAVNDRETVNNSNIAGGSSSTVATAAAAAMCPKGPQKMSECDD
uniref:BTB domain-containing protein n=1 Tax=Globodera rostochiensis TaxID=31243 RepID=A0A914H0H8_GLORO